MEFKLIEFIEKNNYIISNEEVDKLNIIIKKQSNEKIMEKYKDFINSEDVHSFHIILKNWNDYDDDKYEFHSPPDCMYFENDSIHADIIEYYGGKEFTCYLKEGKEEYIIFLPDTEEEFIVIKEWNIKKFLN
jgi:hypothetical protein